MCRRKGLEKQAFAEAAKFLRREEGPFRNDVELLEIARVLFELRWSMEYESLEEEEQNEIRQLEREVRRRLHAAINQSPGDLHLVGIFKSRKLSQIEREIVLVLALSNLGVCRWVGDAEQVQGALARNSRSILQVVRALGEGGRLARAEIIEVERDESPARSGVKLSGDVISPFVRRRTDVCWAVRTQDQLLDRSYELVASLRKRADIIDQGGYYLDRGDDASTNLRAIHRLYSTFCRTLDARSQWPLHGMLRQGLRKDAQLIILALLGKELGFMSPEDDFFTGAGLARCVSDSVPQVRHSIRQLRRDAVLRRESYVRACGGYGDASAMEDEATLMSCEFELTQEFLGKIQVKPRRKRASNARKAKVRPGQLVLPGKTRDAIRMALAQARHNQVLVEKWGLGTVIPYGRAVTMLFSGPPGVGKTASAEAFAFELGKSIIAISYAEIQNCFVGETEKNIVKAFRGASDTDAVLFWDEADSMFYDRDSAYRNWEVRDVNVLLTELERFEGVCILSTNRKITLDRALERRIAIKVEFEPPDQKLRRKIWNRLIPKKMPLAEDVDLEELSLAELTGGEIKNVVLNAARAALCRSPEARVAMADFRKAIEMESHGKWAEDGRARIGFTA